MEAAASLLSYLVLDSENVEALARSGAVPQLIEACGHDNMTPAALRSMGRILRALGATGHDNNIHVDDSSGESVPLVQQMLDAGAVTVLGKILAGATVEATNSAAGSGAGAGAGDEDAVDVEEATTAGCAAAALEALCGETQDSVRAFAQHG